MNWALVLKLLGLLLVKIMRSSCHLGNFKVTGLNFDISLTLAESYSTRGGG